MQRAPGTALSKKPIRTWQLPRWAAPWLVWQRFDRDADVVPLCTIQTRACLEVLLRDGVLEPDPARAEQVGDFPRAYAWMRQQMGERLATSGAGMVWLWAQAERRTLAGECRRSHDSVLMFCQIPRERVLISHFDAWHAVLNQCMWVAPEPGEPAESVERRWDALDAEIEGRLLAAGLPRSSPAYLWPPDLRELAERSWETIFDTERWPGTDHWQATVHRLFASDVVRAVVLK